MLSQIDSMEIGMTPQIGCKITKNYRNNVHLCSNILFNVY